jgi:hypothetical protein
MLEDGISFTCHKADRKRLPSYATGYLANVWENAQS